MKLNREAILIKKGILLPEEAGVLSTLEIGNRNKTHKHGLKGRKPWNAGKTGYKNKVVHKVTKA